MNLLKEVIEPNLKTYMLDSESEKYVSAISKSERLIVNSIERAFFERVENGSLRWSSPLGLSLLARNAQVAQRCGNYEQVEFASSDITENRTPGGVGNLGVVFAPVPTEGYLVCLSVTVDAVAKGELKLFLPQRTGAADQPMYVEGRSVKLSLVPGLQTLKLVLPEYVYGQRLALELGEAPGAQYAITSTTLGELELFGE
jgi:hypothetical protein